MNLGMQLMDCGVPKRGCRSTTMEHLLTSDRPLERTPELTPPEQKQIQKSQEVKLEDVYISLSQLSIEKETLSGSDFTTPKNQDPRHTHHHQRRPTNPRKNRI